MSPLSLSLIAFACVFGGTFLGMFLRSRLPGHHLSGDTKDVVRLGTGLIGTIAALVLGCSFGGEPFFGQLRLRRENAVLPVRLKTGGAEAGVGRRRPMSTLRSDWLVAPDFHPEFGLLCPSPRRRLRLAMTLMTAAIGIGATIELAVAHWRDGDAVAQTLIAGAIDEGPLAEGAAMPNFSGIPVASLRPSAPTAATEAWTVIPLPGSCKAAAAKDLAASFLNPACRPGKVHARHSEWTPYRVATVVIGGSELPPAPAAVEATPYGATAREKR
jgi:hypothetical protein